MSQVFKLFRLQQVDSQLDQRHTRLQEIEAALSDNKALQQAQADMDRANVSLDELRKVLRRSEYDTQDQRLKIEKTETKLYSGRISNPKELEDLQNEAVSLKRYLTVLEDRQLDAMLKVDDAESDAKSAQSAFEKIQAQTIEKNAALLGEQTALQKEVAHLEAERAAAASSIPPTDLEFYESLRRKKGGVAVALVSDRACAACGSILNAALLQDAKSPTKLTRCDFCDRILYGT